MDDETMDTLLLEHLKRLRRRIGRFSCLPVIIHSLILLIDSVLHSGVQRIDDALYERESLRSVTEFATTFNNFIADGPSSHQSLIKGITTFACAIAGVLFGSEGVTHFIDGRTVVMLSSAARQSADRSIMFFQNLQPFPADRLEDQRRYHK
jgi:hypothetical protein